MSLVKAMLGFLKATLVGGLLIVLPVWLAILLILNLVNQLADMVGPIMAALPAGILHPRIVAAALLVLISFGVGLMLKTGVGKWFMSMLEKRVFVHIPGYRIAQALTRQLSGVGDQKFAPILAEIEDSLVPAFEVERHPDGKRTVFVPSAPTPGVGAVYILTPERVHPVDVPLSKAMGCVMGWGVGARDLVEAMRTQGDSGKTPAGLENATGAQQKPSSAEQKG